MPEGTIECLDKVEVDYFMDYVCPLWFLEVSSFLLFFRSICYVVLNDLADSLILVLVGFVCPDLFFLH